MPNYIFSLKPVWVEEVFADISDNKLSDSSYGVVYKLLDEQIFVNNGGHEIYRNLSYKILSKYGLDNYSNVEISFDPSREKLHLHNLKIIRGDESIDFLSEDKIRLSKRERDSIYRIYDETQTLTILLEGITEGDVVEYSYTISVNSSQPAYCFSRYLYLNWAIPIEKTHYKLIVSNELEIFAKNNSGIDAIQSNENGYKITKWCAYNLNPIKYEEFVPNWCNQDKYIELSNTANWKDVVNQILPYFQEAIISTDEIKTLAEQIKNKEKADDQIFLAALEYVRKNIRYVSVSYVASGKVPHPAELTLKRKYGDCKDKTVLLITILRELGIDAFPVLVNSYITKGVKDRLPSSDVFNHAIIYVEFGKRKIFIDPTLDYSAGEIDNIFIPPYKYALILKQDVSDLSIVPEVISPLPNLEISEIYDIRGGYKKESKLSSKTIYRGESAVNIRYMLASNSSEHIRERYRSYYAGMYDDVEIIGLEFNDDIKKNEITLFENYKIHNVWRKVGKFKANFYFTFSELRQWLQLPAQTGSRRYPMQISDSRQYIVKNIVAKLPQNFSWGKQSYHIDSGFFDNGFNNKNSNNLFFKKKQLLEEIDNDFFRLEFKEKIESGVLHSMSILRFNKNIIEPEKFAAYKEQAEKAYDIIFDRFIGGYQTKLQQFMFGNKFIVAYLAAIILYKVLLLTAK